MNRVVMYLEDDELEEIQVEISTLYTMGKMPKCITIDTIRRLCEDYESEDVGAIPDDNRYKEDNNHLDELQEIQSIITWLKR
jgi:hypothetical protein